MVWAVGSEGGNGTLQGAKISHRPYACGTLPVGRSQVSLMARDLDGQVYLLRTRPLDADPNTFVAVDPGPEGP